MVHAIETSETDHDMSHVEQTTWLYEPWIRLEGYFLNCIQKVANGGAVVDITNIPQSKRHSGLKL